MEKRKWILVAMITVFFVISGCSQKSTEPAKVNTDLQISFYQPLNGDLVLVLHSADGREIEMVESFGPDEPKVIKNIENERVSFTVLYNDTSSGYPSRFFHQYSFIKSYIDVVPQHFYFFGRPSDALGYADLNFIYPEGNYAKSHFAIPFEGISSSSVTVQQFRNIPIRQLGMGGFLTIFASVTDTEKMSGYYGWLTTDDVGYKNQYDVHLEHPMVQKNIQTNRQINDYSLCALRDPYDENPDKPYLSFWLNSDFRHDLTSQTEQVILIPDLFPADYYSLRVGNYERTGHAYYYTVVDKQIPVSLQLPTSSVEAVLGDDGTLVENITVSGTVDYLKAGWYYRNYRESQIDWEVYFSPSLKSIRRPVLPDSVFDMLDVSFPQDFDADLCLCDLDAAKGFDDYIGKYSSAKRRNILDYKIRYTYYKRFISTACGFEDQKIEYISR